MWMGGGGLSTPWVGDRDVLEKGGGGLEPKILCTKNRPMANFVVPHGGQPIPREVLGWPYTVGGGEVAPPPPPPKTKVTIGLKGAGSDEGRRGGRSRCTKHRDTIAQRQTGDGPG